MQSKSKQSDFEIEEESIIQYNGSKPNIPFLDINKGKERYQNESYLGQQSIQNSLKRVSPHSSNLLNLDTHKQFGTLRSEFNTPNYTPWMTKRGSKRVDLSNGAHPEKVTSSKYIFENDKFKKISESNVVLEDEHEYYTQQDFEDKEQEYIKLVKKLRFDIELLTTENNSLKISMANQSNTFESETYKQEIQSLKDQLTQEKKQNEHFKSVLTLSQQQGNSISLQDVEWVRKFREMQNLFQKEKLNSEQLREEIENLKLQNSKTRENYFQTIGEINRKRSYNSEQENLIKKLKQKLESQRKQNLQLQNTIQSIDQEEQQIHQKFQILQTQYDKQQNLITELNKKISDYQGSYKNKLLLEQDSQLIKIVDRFNKNIQEKNRLIENLQQQNFELSNKVSEYEQSRHDDNSLLNLQSRSDFKYSIRRDDLPIDHQTRYSVRQDSQDFDRPRSSQKNQKFYKEYFMHRNHSNQNLREQQDFDLIKRNFSKKTFHENFQLIYQHNYNFYNDQIIYCNYFYISNKYQMQQRLSQMFYK